MNKGVYIASIIVLIILLVVGILLIIFKNRISPTNSQAIFILGIAVVIISILLLGILTLSYARSGNVRGCKVGMSTTTSDSFQVQTDRPVLITVTQLDVHRPIEVRPIQTRVSECTLKPVISQVQRKNEYIVPVTIEPTNVNRIPETIIGTI